MNRIVFYFKNKVIIPFDELPMGYKRLFSMVFDIAYRSYILNKDIEPRGIVIIDEIELHLHPTLQQELLARFRKTFPLIQFIVSTHSPLVISNLKEKEENGNNKIIKMTKNDELFENEVIENIYGIDYNTSLAEIMDANFRASDIESLIDSYVMMKSRNKDVIAENIKKELFDIVGENNEIIQKEIDRKLQANL
jgi:predicted ATP-binding protein involved in virulence